MRLPGTILLAVAALPGCSRAAPETPPPPSPRTLTLSILATNDVHGQLGKEATMSGYVSNLRRARQRDGGVLLVDAGDVFQGTLESNSNEGRIAIATYNAMGYDAVSLGNHEFDFGPEGPKGIAETAGEDPQGALRARLAEARFPVLSANLRDASGAVPPWRNLAPSVILHVAGVSVGVVGLLTAETPHIVKKPLFRNLRVASLPETAAAEAARLHSQGAIVVVVVAHAGGQCRRFEDPTDLTSCDPESEIFRLARALPPGSVDAIVGGHENSAVAHVVNGIPIAHAPSHLVAFSRIDLVVDRTTRKIVERRVLPPHALCLDPAAAVCTPGDYEGRPVVADESVARVVAPALDAAQETAGRRLGVRVAAPFPVAKGSETALGNLFADLMRSGTPGAEVAIANAGSIRDTLPGGDLTFGQLYHVMPFDNQLALLKMRGSELRAALRANLTQKEHGPLSISGVRVSAHCIGEKLAIDILRPDGSRVADGDEIVVATSDFLAWGGDGLLGPDAISEDRVSMVPGLKVLDVLARGLEARRTIQPDDRALFDPEHPRMQHPGPLPVVCP